MSQHMDALARANQVRLERSASKREMRDSRLSFVEALDLPCWQTATVRCLLKAVRWVGDTKADQILSRAQIGPARTVENLTAHSRAALIAALPDRLTA
jgi:hypothetical protein